MKTNDDIPSGPFSEQELREQWNRQADEFNQWDSLDSDEKLGWRAWAQTQALSSGGWIVPSMVNAQPPLANDDPIRAALERLVARLNETTDRDGPVPAWSDSFYAALATLAKAEPAPTGKDSLQVAQSAEGGVTPTMLGDRVASLASRLAAESTPMHPDVATAVGDAWDLYEDAPGPAGRPAEGEVAELVEFLRIYGDFVMDEYGDVGEHDQLTRAAELLAQRHPAPVAVSERLPGAEDCTTNPRTGRGQWCWGWVQHDPLPYSGRWRMMRREWLADEATHWLPAHALPLPAAIAGAH